MYKKKKNELARIKTLIENDRFTACEDFETLLKKDLKKLLLDYFDIDGSVEIAIKKDSGRYVFTAMANAICVKNFAVIPKE
ncbi:MAG: hypothetical protein E7362_04915 [Clostridiales bacterium]|nr:hypothetical protein [Clostridiales bacterium]